MKKVEVVAGVVFHEDTILCVQRPYSKLPYISEKYEFPGGKIEVSESKEEALHRELFEELDISMHIKSFFLTVIHEYPDFELTMHSFICEVNDKRLKLHEHIDYKWLRIDELSALDWAAADIPIVNKLISNG
ncbi:MAG: (deoxy)nucleoside triphosphate pyrophosphohydrolase [Bacteroidia bacterium]|jgi:8-oxo-dGTP diphosphatase